MRYVSRIRSAAKSWPPSKRCARSWTRCPGWHGAPLTSPAWGTRSAPPAPPPAHPAEPSGRPPGLASARHVRCRISATAGPAQRRRGKLQPLHTSLTPVSGKILLVFYFKRRLGADTGNELPVRPRTGGPPLLVVTGSLKEQR